MIPLPVAPLKGVSVLVTRPAHQSTTLCSRIEELGGEAISFPVIAIEPLPFTAPADSYDWLIFVSVNAVNFGLPLIARTERTRIAAIGKATMAALEARNVSIDAMPTTGSTSEALLAYPALAAVSTQSVLLVKGAGGRELLHDALIQRGARVSTIDVYRRVLPQVDSLVIQQLEQRWRDERIDVVTLTSVETLANLQSLLSDAGRTMLASTPYVVVSERIAHAAREVGLAGPCIVSRGPDDESIVGAIAARHARAR